MEALATVCASIFGTGKDLSVTQECARAALVLAYGQREFDGQGGIRYLMTADSIASLRRAVGHTQRVDALAGVYAVVSAEDSTLITVGHRFG